MSWLLNGSNLETAEISQVQTQAQEWCLQSVNENEQVPRGTGIFSASR